MIAVGIDLGGTNIKAALVDKKKGFVETVTIPTHADMGKDHVFDRIAMAVEELMEISKKKTHRYWDGFTGNGKTGPADC